MCLRLDPIKEVHESVGGLLESIFETWNIYWEYIYVIFLHTDIHTNSLVLIHPAQPTQKDWLRCYSATLQELTEDDTGWIKADQLVGMPLFK